MCPISLGPLVYVKGGTQHHQPLNTWVMNSDKPQLGAQLCHSRVEGPQEGPHPPNLGFLAHSDYAHLRDTFEGHCKS